MTESTELLKEMEQDIVEAYRGILNDGQIEWAVKWWTKRTKEAIAKSKLEWQSQLRKEIEGVDTGFVGSTELVTKKDVLNLLQETNSKE